MSGAGAWEALLDRSVRAFYEGNLAEGRLACDRLLCLPDLPANVREVSRTNQVHYARPIAELVPSYREAAINLPMGEGSVLRQATIASDGDDWLVLFQATMPVITPWDGRSGGDAGQQAFHVAARVSRDLRPVGDAARVANQTVAPGSRGEAARLEACHLARLGQGWVAVARAPAGEGAGGGEVALLDFDPGAPAFRNLRVLMQDAGSGQETDWMPAISDDALHLVHLRGATAAVRRGAATCALTMAAFNDAPFVAQELHGVSPLVEIDDGLLGLVHDGVTWGSGEVSHLYRFARLDRSFQMTELSHPFLVQGTSGESAGGLAIADGTLALAHVVDGRALHVVTLDLAEALALLQPVELLAPGGLHAFAMPDGLLAALQQWVPPVAPDTVAIDLDQMPVLRPETVIAEMQREARDAEIAPIDAHVPAEDLPSTSTASREPGIYDEQFYSIHHQGALNSARVVVPHAIDVIQPKSVVDLGCGTGEWLAAFRELGVEDVLGVDGDWLPRERLPIPLDRFMAHDLCEPLRLERTFDLAISLETAEHLSPECAETFVASLVGLAPAVLFSAAVPGQGGRDHRNPQWPRYWAERFAAHGYVTIDCIRPRICTAPDVQWWYTRNCFLFVERSLVERHGRLRQEYETSGGPPMPWVNEDYWLGDADSWAAEFRRVRDACQARAEAAVATIQQLERLVAELRGECDREAEEPRSELRS